MKPACDVPMRSTLPAERRSLTLGRNLLPGDPSRITGRTEAPAPQPREVAPAALQAVRPHRRDRPWSDAASSRTPIPPRCHDAFVLLASYIGI